MRSANVDLPWSMCAMMQKLRMIAGGVWPGWGPEWGVDDGDTLTWLTDTFG
jgi:hypothetical protein